MIKTPVMVDIDRYDWIIREAGGAGEVCRIRRDTFDSESILDEVVFALNTVASAQRLVEIEAQRPAGTKAHGVTNE